jgi:plastocyanin
MKSYFRLATPVVVAFGMAAAVPGVHASVPAATAAVHIANFTFSPATITVRPGTTVTWTNDDDIPHTVVATNGAFRSKVLDSGEHFSFTFVNAGEYHYYCSIHPHMTGTVIVKG